MDQQTAGDANVADQLRSIVHEAEVLLEALNGVSDQSLGDLRERVYRAVDTAKARLADLEQQADQLTQRAARAAETYVREHPWAAVAIGAAIGLMLGALIASRAGGARSGERSTPSDGAAEAQ